ncbi:Ribose-phosphate pyrophosphokinase 2, chloroplastic [Zea mays]|uniref:ribose-phosphate diphosphokinase n=1 Tax=Zea mays TaxID=4577 RepID=A0A3L6DEB8_MAIZE|nr:Ribose-phosphate pyrophosphokinase 2, chloroplastic [Zea mays]
MAATAAAAGTGSSLSSRRSRSAVSSPFRAAASRFRSPRCVLGSEQLRVAHEGKRMSGAESRTAAWAPKVPAPESRLAALPRELRDSRMKIFSGTANRPLAQEIAAYLGIELGKILIKRFADGEIYVQLQESAQGREPITAKLAANLLTEAGSDRVIVCDIHSTQALGYFDIPVDHIYGQPVILDYLASKTISEDLVVVSPDVGGVVRARAFAKKLLNARLAIVDKRRQGHNMSEVMNLIGDVKGKVAILIDDMIDTADMEMVSISNITTRDTRPLSIARGILFPPAIERLSGGVFEEVIVTNSILLPEDKCFPQLTVLSMANLVGETIWHVHRDGSVSSIFQ